MNSPDGDFGAFTEFVVLVVLEEDMEFSWAFFYIQI